MSRGCIAFRGEIECRSCQGDAGLAAGVARFPGTWSGYVQGKVGGGGRCALASIGGGWTSDGVCVAGNRHLNVAGRCNRQLLRVTDCVERVIEKDALLKNRQAEKFRENGDGEYANYDERHY